VAGLAKDLHLVGLKWNAVLTVFFIPYALLEVPSNIILKMVRPSIYIPGIMFAWGTVMTLMGLVNGYSGLIAARFFLGVAEAGPTLTFCDRLRLTADRPGYSRGLHICSHFGTFGTKSRPGWSSSILVPPCLELFLDF
jgi:hypothetical protein